MKLSIAQIKKASACLVMLSLFLPAAFAEPSGLQQTYTLRRLLDIAVKNHPTLRQSEASINQEKGLETESRAGYLPQINFNNNYSRANSRGSAFGTSTAFTFYNSVFSLSQLITDFGKTGASILASHLAVAQARENYRNSYQQVLFNVYQAYYQVLADESVVKVQDDSVKNLNEHLRQAEAFFKVGTRPKIDVTQAEVNLSNGNLSLVQAKNNLAVSLTTLESAVAGPTLSYAQLEGTLSFNDFAITLDSALKTAYDNRPDLMGLEDELASAKASLVAAEKGQNPTLSGSTTYGWNDNVFPPTGNTWSFGASLNFPLFNGFYTRGQVEVARAQVDQIAAQIDNLKLNIRQSVEQAYLNLQSAKTSLKVAEDSLRYARENFQLAKGRYGVGVGNYLEYTDAQVGLVQAETNGIQALANYNIAVASLRQAMGTLEETQ